MPELFFTFLFLRLPAALHGAERGAADGDRLTLGVGFDQVRLADSRQLRNGGGFTKLILPFTYLTKQNSAIL